MFASGVKRCFAAVGNTTFGSNRCVVSSYRIGDFNKHSPTDCTSRNDTLCHNKTIGVKRCVVSPGFTTIEVNRCVLSPWYWYRVLDKTLLESLIHRVLVLNC